MNKSIHTEVVIIGGGPSGYSAAFRCADLGLSTVLVEEYNNLGGVCLNVGCIPSKALLYVAKVIKDSKKISSAGVFFESLKIDLDKINLWKNTLVNKLAKGLFLLSNKKNIKVIKGSAQFLNNNSIVVNVNNDKGINVYFKNVIIATGSSSINFPGIPPNDSRIWNSNDALKLQCIPKRLLIIGGGVIGLEMATIYASLGSKIDIVDSSKQILSSVDTDVISVYTKLINSHFNLYLETKIIKIDSRDDGLWVTMNIRNLTSKIVCYDIILIAIGRFPCFKKLRLDKIKIETDESGFIKVDSQLRTSKSHIYAIGDVVGNPMLAHKGIYQGKIVSDIISGKKVFYEPLVVPSIAYTDPEVAWVGVTEREAILKNINYKTAIFPWIASGRAIISNSETGCTKLIFDKDSKRIIGGSIVGSNAGELLGEISLAIEMGCEAEDISLTMHAHPTLYETIGLSSEVFQGISIDF